METKDGPVRPMKSVLAESSKREADADPFRRRWMYWSTPSHSLSVHHSELVHTDSARASERERALCCSKRKFLVARLHRCYDRLYTVACPLQAPSALSTYPPAVGKISTCQRASQTSILQPTTSRRLTRLARLRRLSAAGLLPALAGNNDERGTYSALQMGGVCGRAWNDLILK